MSSVKPGDVLAGKYRVERVLGSGGMGYVVAARHLQLDQLVAMKFLRRNNNSLDETEATGRFLREAKAVVRLKDEHVAKVFDVGTLETGEPYIVMEYLDGCDLSALAKQRGAIPVAEGVEYIMQACEALAEAHSIGIVHRDVKLANLFITRGHAGSPLVKVLDFGISKVNPFGGNEADQEMTKTASMLGSPRFMSPEQMRDPRNVDARSDIWSLGVVLYRLIAGRPPFEADTLGRLLSMVMHENPDLLSAIRNDLPPGFSETIQRCLEKDANARYSNIAELAYALAPFAVDPARARGVADRIAATLSVAQMPHQSIEISVRMSMPSGINVVPSPSSPPGASDTGTAAPWAGTQGGGRRESTRAGLVWGAVVLAGLLVAGGLFAKVRSDRAEAVAASNAAAAAAQQQAPAALGESEPPPLTAPPVGTTAPVVIGSATTVSDRGAEPATPAARPPVTAEERRRPPAPPPPRRPQQQPHGPAANPVAAPAAAPAAPRGGGIPATRD